MFTFPTTYFETIPPDPHLMVNNQVVSITDSVLTLSGGTWTGYKTIPSGVTTLYILLIGQGQSGGADYSGATNKSGWSGGCYGVKLTSQTPGTHVNISIGDPATFNPAPGISTQSTNAGSGADTNINIGSYGWSGYGGFWDNGPGGITSGSPPNSTVEENISCYGMTVGSSGRGGSPNNTSNISFGPLSYTNAGYAGYNGTSFTVAGAGHGYGGGTSYSTTCAGSNGAPGCIVFAW